ncbi:hypothetical protein HMPREF0880_01713 [Yokenella regensburgei ATCC 43003]|jgi:hypothetical protein|nr:hypothetical protein HMPREF0880_01713 [Yokenella regensburgei ATCC 43003]
MTSYLSAVATYQPTECISDVLSIRFYGTDTELSTSTDGKVRAVPDIFGFAPPLHHLLRLEWKMAAQNADIT